MTQKALLIAWNQSTGKRAGNIDPKDPALHCSGWQNMDVTPAIELRIIQDDRDIKQYVTMEGVTVLYGPDQINEAIDTHFPSKYVIEDENIYAAHLNSISHLINFNELPTDHMKRLKFLKEQHNIKGIREIQPQKV